MIMEYCELKVRSTNGLQGTDVSHTRRTCVCAGIGSGRLSYVHCQGREGEVPVDG